MLEKLFEKGKLDQVIFFGNFWKVYFCLHFCYLVVCIEVCSCTQISLRYDNDNV